MKVLILIPAFNEAKNLERVIRSLNAYVPDYDYIVVNDGSTDATAEVCRAHGFPLLDLPTNLGLAGAFQTGMKYALQQQYDAVLQFDGDGQHLPEYIEPMIQELHKGVDIVIGSRMQSGEGPQHMRAIGSALIRFAIWLTTGAKIKDPTSGMRLYNKRMIAEFAQYINHSPEPDTISYLLRRGIRVSEVPVAMAPRQDGASYFTPAKSAAYMLRMAVSILLVQWFRGGKKFAPVPAESEVSHVS